MNIQKLDDNTMILISKSDLMEAFKDVLTNGKSEPINNNFINIDEVATITGYKRPTLYRFVALKQIPHYKRKGRICFKQQEIGDWMNQGKCTV